MAALRERWPGTIDAVGIAMPATVAPDGIVTAWPSRPQWTGLDLRRLLDAVAAGAPAGFADDGDLAALAEARHAGRDDIVYLGVGTGIGGGIVLDGRSRPGAGRGSCEVGHIVVDRSGPVCVCGRRGCLQAVASGPATLRRAAGQAGRDVDFGQLRDGWRDGEAWAVAAVTETCAALAAAVVSLGELLHPTVAIIGGGFATGLPGFVPRVAAEARTLGRPGHPPPPVAAAALGGLSSLFGAVQLARHLAAPAPHTAGTDPERKPA